MGNLIVELLDIKAHSHSYSHSHSFGQKKQGSKIIRSRETEEEEDMGDEASSNEDWVYMVTARAPTNIAVVKYWGKHHEKLILPINSSISVTLDPEDLSATTTVSVSPSFTSDCLWLNGKVRMQWRT